MRYFTNARDLAVAIWQMTRLSWRVQPWCFLGMFALDLFQGVLPILNAWVLKSMLDVLAQQIRVDEAISFPGALLPLLVGQAVLVFLGPVLAFTAQFLQAELGRQLTLTIRTEVYGKIATLQGLLPFEEPAFYDTIRLAAQSADGGPAQVLHLFTAMVRSGVTLLSFTGILLTFSPLLALGVGLAMFPHLYAQLRLSKRRYGLEWLNSPYERRAAYYGSVLSESEWAKELRLFNLAPYFLGLFRQVTIASHQAQRSYQLTELRWQTGLSLVSSAAAAGAFVAVIAAAVAGRLTLGDILLYVSAVASVQSSLQTIIFGVAGVYDGILFHEHYRRLLALPQPLELAEQPQPVPPLRIGIEFRSVSFRYSDAHPWVLQQASFFLPAQTCVALVGLNSAGKTTLVKLLARLYEPTDGAIFWDGIDIRQFDPIVYRRCIAAIFQDFAHYDLSAAENIAVGNIAQINDSAQIQRAAMKANCHERLTHLPQGYDTLLTRWFATADVAGVELSGGEWQRVALARMFMKEAQLLILDEPTAALDAEAEYELYHRFQGLVAGCTSLIISHRFSTVQMASVIAVLEEGRIVEYGSHQALLEEQGLYARLYGMQATPYRQL